MNGKSLNTRTSDILAALATDARRLRVGQRLPKEGEIPWNLVERVREDFNFMLDQPGVTMEIIGNAIGLSRGPLSRFRNAATREGFVGDLDKTTRQINTFLETIVRRRDAKLPDGFVKTKVAERMLTVIGKTIELSSIGVICADAGRGKSMTLRAATRIYPGSVLLRIRQHTKKPTGLAKAIGDAMRLRGLTRRLSARRAECDRERCKGTGPVPADRRGPPAQARGARAAP